MALVEAIQGIVATRTEQALTDGRRIGPQVSVLIPCFNLGAYLDEAVNSVLGQTFQDFEILVVDDGSTDRATARLLRDYERPRTRVFHTENRGLAKARNLLIAQARGEYLCSLDADDLLHPRYLEATVAVPRHQSAPDLRVVTTSNVRCGNAGVAGRGPVRLPMLLCDDTVITAALVRRSAVVAMGGFDEQMPSQGDEDWALWLALVESGHLGTILPDVLFYYRQRPNSMCLECTQGDTHLRLVEYLVKKHEGSYRRHLEDVLLWKEARIGALRRHNMAAEADLAIVLRPAVARRRAELDRLRRGSRIPGPRQAAPRHRRPSRRSGRSTRRAKRRSAR